MSKPESVKVDGVLWSPYIIDYKTDEGDFSFHVMATSFDHAAAIVTDIRQTATLAGKFIESIDFDADEED